MSNFLNPYKYNENQKEKFQKIYTYYPEFKKQINYKPNKNGYLLYNLNYITDEKQIIKNHKNISSHKSKSIYLDGSYNKIINCRDENHNYNNYKNKNFSLNPYEKNVIIKKNSYNRFRNINMKSYNSENVNNEDIYEEYIIDYKEGLNHGNFRKRKNISTYNDKTMENHNDKNKKLNVNHNRTYYNGLINNLENKNNLNEVTKYKKQINKNNTCNYFYNVDNTKINQIKKFLNVPYKKRIVNDYTFNDFKENNKNINNNIKYSKNKNKYLTCNNNTSETFIKINNIIKNKYQTINIDDKKYKKIIENRENNKPNENNKIKYNLKPDNANIENEDLIKVKKFMHHFSKYSILYYYKIIKQLFSSLRKIKISKSNKYSTINTSKSKIPVPPFHKIPTPSNNNNSSRKRFGNHSNRKNQTPQIGNNILIDRIRTKNESKSPNDKNGQEMIRNVQELSKKCEIISNRKYRRNNTSLKKVIKDISFNNENKTIKEFRFSSVEKNREKMETIINKERERKKKISQKKNKENMNKEISNLIHKNKILQNKIKNLEKNGKKTIEINWNLDNIIIKSKEKKKENNIYLLENNEKNRTINEMINVKKITTKDKSINININYLNYIPLIKNKNENNKNDKFYEIRNICNINYFGSLDNIDKKGKEIKYHNELTSIKEEENKIDFSENISQYSFEGE